ncbi:YeeE/YedE family protein [Gilvimarinus algae]|uniref:YeeE/YedE family protein n=1 Tax=Gilvimarinus algae TaxID=3058037 RepID=A0ABT8T9S2_9GAMM|nr:YeeE/YedE family protein [Gilvimarinus sp. SDUM040014]MDO3380852.1 YeeE/YedE family protein [Gilvimarinus sp. SDUM040014]
MKSVFALICGLLFGAGLAMSGMTDTAKVLGFLDLFGRWDPALMFVMGGAVVVTLVGFRLVLRRSRPVCDERFNLPANRRIDRRLLAGAAVFGLGWGLYGYCPGPALSALVYLEIKTLAFVLAMISGMAVVHGWEKREAKRL